MSAVLAVAVKVIVCICVASFVVSVLFVAKCLREAAWDRRHRPAQPGADDQMALVNATKELRVPTDAEIEHWTADWEKRFGR